MLSASFRPSSRLKILSAALVFLGSCATTPNVPDAEPTVPVTTPAEPQTSDPVNPFVSAPMPIPRPVSFEALPGWGTADLSGSIQAFERSCALWTRRDDDDPISGRISYAGRVGDWRPACAAIEVAEDSESARRIFEALFVPVEVLTGTDDARFTGYFEPQIEARRTPEFPFTEPVPGLPADLVQVDRSALGGAAGRTVPAQKLANGGLRPYPPRGDIVTPPENALGYAHPADVFFLQIQGSGRLVFEDGSMIRAAYAAHNGQPFRSTANYLMRTEKISRGEASMQGIRAWMDRVSRQEARQAMNQNPRFVFFRPLAIGDPGLGPEGAQAVPLTPLGSMAIDTDIHALGVPFFVQTSAPGLGGDWSGLLIAQDTGGAIKGRVRGDIYYGTGAEAGRRAGTQNAPGRMWAFLPRRLAEQLETSTDTADS